MRTTHPDNIMNRVLTIAWLIAAMFIGIVPQVAQARIPIERMQRELQARFHYLTVGNYVVWPPFRSGKPAPLYPPDNFYGDLDGDPEFAAYLVQDLIYQFYGDIPEIG